MRLSIYGVIAVVSIVSSACSREAAVPGAATLAASTAAKPGNAAAAPALEAVSNAEAARARPARELTIPSGTHLPIVLDDTVGSDISRPEQPVHAHLSRAVIVRGETVLPSGSRLTGVVTDATRSAKVKGRAHVGVRFTAVAPRGDGERYTLRAAPVGRMAPATKKADAIKIGAPAAGGAIVGGLLGGKKGALIGTAVGAGGGTAVVMTTRGKEVRLRKGTALSLRLSAPLTVRVRG
jgi:hypothetical protein